MHLFRVYKYRKTHQINNKRHRKTHLFLVCKYRKTHQIDNKKHWKTYLFSVLKYLKKNTLMMISCSYLLNLQSACDFSTQTSWRFLA